MRTQTADVVREAEVKAGRVFAQKYPGRKFLQMEFSYYSIQAGWAADGRMWSKKQAIPT